LLVLLPVFAGVPGSEHLFVVTCLVVLLSVVLHGGGIALYLRRGGASLDTVPVASRAASAPTVSAPTVATASATAVPNAATAAASARSAPVDVGDAVPERITIAEFRDLHRSSAPLVVADVRTERSYRDDPNIGVGAIRLPPDDAVRLARERRLDQHATLVLYCA
ncbi:MAG: hypothetical protein ABIY46_07315, partial [Gemmatimonadales bacterium]